MSQSLGGLNLRTNLRRIQPQAYWTVKKQASPCSKVHPMTRGARYPQQRSLAGLLLATASPEVDPTRAGQPIASSSASDPPAQTADALPRAADRAIPCTSRMQRVIRRRQGPSRVIIIMYAPVAYAMRLCTSVCSVAAATSISRVWMRAAWVRMTSS